MSGGKFTRVRHRDAHRDKRTSTARHQDARRNLARAVVLGLVLKLGFAAAVIGVGFLLGWPTGKMFGLALLVWLSIDLIMTWREERRSARGEFELLNDMVGEIGEVTMAFVKQGDAYHGRIWVHGETWAAVFPGQRALERGEKIRVRGREGLTLVVHPHGQAGTGQGRPAETQLCTPLRVPPNG